MQPNLTFIVPLATIDPYERKLMIKSIDWEGNELTLVNEAGEPIKEGDTLKTFRGEKVIVTGGKAPHKSSSTGKVWVKDGEFNREYYPSVVGAKWE